ncbi:hypothetical protein NUW54_g12299 [Trametes sanguinea]|uniref:Uncharacterized protein n=1 Tax=Trametes sanguinea TaxID=158606 RepID=A0ACC1N072_9APHY|nr:hypothetical protein NUW54_g12299 [Trametes sanguinea]
MGDCPSCYAKAAQTSSPCQLCSNPRLSRTRFTATHQAQGLKIPLDVDNDAALLGGSDRFFLARIPLWIKTIFGLLSRHRLAAEWNSLSDLKDAFRQN